MSITPLSGLAFGQNDTKSSANLSDLAKSKLANSIENRPHNSADQLDKASVSASSIQRFQAAYQYSNNMSLQLTTREGDQVTVDFRQLYAQYQEFNRQQAMEEGPKGVRYFESREAMEMTAFEERFGISVEGDLNEQELGAIFDVFEQVDQLANNFYNGDIEKAFQQAIDLQVDFGQIQSLNLDLSRSEMRAVSYQQGAASKYQQVQDQPQGEALGVKDLPPYLQAWQSAIERLDEQFSESQKIFDEMMSGTLAQRFPEQDSKEGWLERVSNLHQELSGLLGLNASTPEQASANESVANPKEIQSD